MTKMDIVNNLSRTFHRVGFKFKKHSPEILVTAGVVGVVASTIMACKATTKIDTILDEAKEKVDRIHKHVENPKLEEKYTKEDSKKDLAIVYTRTGLKLAKLYAPAVVIGATSLGCILTSHNIIRKRNVALAAAYATVDNSFKDYRKRVVERFGKELDRELKYNIKAEQIEETTTNAKGETKTEKKTVNVARIDEYSEYAKFFDDGCKGWSKDPEYNLYFLRQTQQWANQKLQANGYLFLNEVYEMLGIHKTQAGQVVGWVYDKNEPIGDNYVDFGIFDVYKEGSRDFVNGRERTILLDFNVDGNILQLMP